MKIKEYELKRFELGHFGIFNDTEKTAVLNSLANPAKQRKVAPGMYAIYYGKYLHLRTDWVNALKFIPLRNLSEIIEVEKKEPLIDLETYQTIIEKTAIYPKQIGLAYCAMGLTGEAGEVAEKIKKLYRDGASSEGGLPTIEHNQSIIPSLKKELGDVIWYISALASELGLTLEEVMEANYNKLMKRKETGTLQGSGDDREES